MDGSIAADGQHVYAAWFTLPYLMWSSEPSDIMYNSSANAGLTWNSHDNGNGTVLHASPGRGFAVAAASGLAVMV